MGLTIILAIVFSCIATFWFDELHKNFKSINNLIAFKNTIINIVFSTAIAAGITVVLTFGIKAFEAAKVELVDRQITELQEIEPNLYVITGVHNNPRGADYATVTVKVNDDFKEVYLKNSKIFLNWYEAIMETRYYDFANDFLNFLLFSPDITEHDIYVPQSSLDGEFSIQ